MPSNVTRRALLTGSLAIAAATVPGTVAAKARAGTTTQELRRLERTYDARLGVYARNLRTGATVTHRADERFAILSVFKGLAAAHVLRDHDLCGEFLATTIHYTAADLVPYSPITEQHVDTGMTVSDLCFAAICYSDNTAGNLLLRETGGPAGLTRFCRSLGDPKTRLDRWEIDLNTSIPGDPRDTTTPQAIGRTYARLVVGRALRGSDRAQLTDWLEANTTGAARLRAGLPADWALGEKTGTGGYGSANDVGIAWTPTGTPIALAVLSVKHTEDAVADNRLIADTARILARELGD